ncbi:penicillin-binding transpeptidase domain-containing protein [Thalassotalea castellviae]|uniref:beta-lactamase n=1 Tax=Thalassotalea castellviae TaxID=3075612 RepID=A0ABU3A2A3_9GAMM|nr:penicillin-binding transpeptidase domain-containing protein [Thalassotalea sp. W431]MDT0604315.1 penicillin-binding transpeptidase domain-containing protein [Thalassotalea sp. W431]
MLRLFVPLFTLVITLTAATWFWAGKPTANTTLLTHIELPASLQKINQNHTLPLQYQSGHNELWFDDARLITLGGQFQQEYKIDICEQRRFLLPPNIAPKPLFVGLDFSQIQSLLHNEKKFKSQIHDYLHGPILDKSGSDEDLPGVIISSEYGFSIKAIEQVKVITDTQRDDFTEFAFVSNDKFTLVLQQIDKKTNKLGCTLGILSIRVYKHSLHANIMHYWLNDNNNWIKGNVKEGLYPAQNQMKYGIQSLNQYMQQCGLMKLDGDRWQFASRYFYTEKLTSGQFNAEKSAHCQKVLAAFYHTPAGEVLRNRALATEEIAKSIAAVALPADVNVKAFSGVQPVKLSLGDISNYQDLFYRDSNHQSLIWHKVLKEQVSFSFNAPGKAFYLYVLGRDVTITGATFLETSDQCIKGLCQQAGDVTLYYLKPTSSKVSIKANGVRQALSPILKKRTIKLGEKPSLHAFNDTTDNGGEEKFSVVDRNGKKLETKDIPHLLAPYAGRINRSMGNNIMLTIDKAMQNVVSQKLNEYINAMDEKPSFATVSVANANGELLVLAQTPQASNETNYQRAGYIQATKPIHSPLTFLAAYHDDSQRFVSGSVFKLLSALLIAEKLGGNHPMVKGLTFEGWKKAQGETLMNPELGCFPTQQESCVANGLSNFIFNGEKQTIYNRTYDREGNLKHSSSAYGLKEAIRDSLNTYFAFMVNKVAKEPFYWQSAFGNDGYANTSPLRQFISQFGFYKPLRLDAGLLGDAALNSVLNVPASKLRHYNVESQFWRAAVGEQNRVTALQVAQFTLAIAKQRLVPLSLLKSVDGRQAKVSTNPINVKQKSFELVQEAMLLAGKNYKALKELPFDIYAKSGTGEISRKHNNAWMTAYVNRQNPVVITCQIGQVTGTGGDLCGRLIAELLKSEVFSQH